MGSWRGKFPTEEQFKVRLKLWPPVKLKDAIGERRFRAWKLAQERKMYTSEDSMRMSTKNLNQDEKDNALDLNSLLSGVGDEAAPPAAESSAAGGHRSRQSGRWRRRQLLHELRAAARPRRQGPGRPPPVPGEGLRGRPEARRGRRKWRPSFKCERRRGGGRL